MTPNLNQLRRDLGLPVTPQPSPSPESALKRHAIKLLVAVGIVAGIVVGL
jgi:hypothetical protein